MGLIEWIKTKIWILRFHKCLNKGDVVIKTKGWRVALIKDRYGYKKTLMID